MKNKKLLVSILPFLMVYQVFAISDPYSTADKKTKQILTKCDKLIEEKQYESAYNSLNTETYNEYILAKKIDICVEYFSQSMMHQMFCLSNLKEGQTLYDVRTGDGSFNMIMADPVKMVESYVAENGEKPILNYILGLYYSSVLNCYGSNWLKTEEEINRYIVDYYQKAFDKNCYTGYALSELALSYIRLGDYDKGTQIYDYKKSTNEEFTVEDNYNYGYACFIKQDYDKALPMLLRSIKDYEDNFEYQYDVYFILSALYINISKFDEAEKVLQNCISIIDNDYRVYERQIILYAIVKDKDKILAASKKLFSMAPSNPSAPQMVMQDYFDYGVQDWLIDFFVGTEELYKDDLSAMQNLYFHHAFTLSYLGKTKEAKTMAKTAREYFKKDGSLTEQILEQLDSIGK